MQKALEKARKAWEVKKDYDADAIPEVWSAYKEYRAEFPDKYPYNAEIEAYIAKKYAVPVELADILGTQVYLAQHQSKRERDNVELVAMQAQGFIPITAAIEYRGPVEVKAKKQTDFLTQRIPESGKFVDGQYGAFFIPKGRRTRGYSLALVEGYYKPTN